MPAYANLKCKKWWDVLCKGRWYTGIGASLRLLGSLSNSSGECGNKSMAIQGVVCMCVCVLGGVKEVSKGEVRLGGRERTEEAAGGEGM